MENNGSVSKTLARSLQLWCQGHLEERLLEARALQYNFRKTTKISKIDEVKQFNKSMETGKISKAINCLTGELSAGILSANDTINGKTVYELLKEKH